MKILVEGNEKTNARMKTGREEIEMRSIRARIGARACLAGSANIYRAQC